MSDRPSGRAKAKWLYLLAAVLLLAAAVAGWRVCREWLPRAWKDFALSRIEVEPFAPEPEHVAALFTWDELAELLSEPGATPGETTLRGVDYGDGSWYLNHKMGRMEGPGPALSCALSVEADAEDARRQYETWLAMSGLDGSPRVDFVCRSLGDFPRGQAGRAGRLELEGEAVGNVVVVLAGERVIWVEWRGAVLEDVESVARVLEPSLERTLALRRKDGSR